MSFEHRTYGRLRFTWSENTVRHSPHQFLGVGQWHGSDAQMGKLNATAVPIARHALTNKLERCTAQGPGWPLGSFRASRVIRGAMA